MERNKQEIDKKKKKYLQEVERLKAELDNTKKLNQELRTQQKKELERGAKLKELRTLKEAAEKSAREVKAENAKLKENLTSRPRTVNKRKVEPELALLEVGEPIPELPSNNASVLIMDHVHTSNAAV